MQSKSQAGQDIFAYTITKQKMNGSFLEIGANHPIVHNNTYIMESKLNWKGLMVEYDKSFGEQYKIHRAKSVYSLNDARTVDYRGLLEFHGFPLNIDYLQIDLDVDNRSTLDTFLLLNNTVFDKYKFATITFEHDIYSGNYFDTQSISRRILKEKGYELVFPDVKVFWEGEFKPFEDWYVHPELVDMEYVNKIKTEESMNCDDIKKLLLST
jgi:hypothetical protein